MNAYHKHISERSTSSLLAFTMFSLILLTWGASYAGDDKRPEGGSGYFNDELAKVSYGLALLEANARYKDELECYVQRQFGKHAKIEDETKKTDSSEILRLFEMKKTEEKEWCAVFVGVAKDTKEIAQTALQSNAAPTEGFLFYAWRFENPFSYDDKEYEDSKYKAGKFPPGQTDEPVGLFKTLESCQATESRIRKLDGGTRSCRPWTNSWFAKAQPPAENAEAILDFKKAFVGAAGILFSAGGLFWVYKLALTVYVSPAPKTRGQRFKDYLQSLVVVAFITLMAWSAYGTHFEGDDDTGSYVQDFKPTKQGRNEHGMEVSLILLVSVWLGVKNAHGSARLPVR